MVEKKSRCLCTEKSQQEDTECCLRRRGIRKLNKNTGGIHPEWARCFDMVGKCVENIKPLNQNTTTNIVKISSKMRNSARIQLSRRMR